MCLSAALKRANDNKLKCAKGRPAIAMWRGGPAHMAGLVIAFDQDGRARLQTILTKDEKTSAWLRNYLYSPIPSPLTGEGILLLPLTLILSRKGRGEMYG